MKYKPKPRSVWLRTSPVDGTKKYFIVAGKVRYGKNKYTKQHQFVEYSMINLETYKTSKGSCILSAWRRSHTLIN